MHINDGSSWPNPNGNRYVPYLDWDGSKRKLSLNWFGYDWRDRCRFLAVRNCFHVRNLMGKARGVV